MKKLLTLLTAAMMLTGTVALAENVDATSGASQVVHNELQLPQEEIRALAVDYLRGFPLTKNEDGSVKDWAYREMYQIATVHGDMPGLSSVEFVLDPDTMRLYCSSEKGTEKVVDIATNPNVVMYWYKQIPETEYVPQVNDYFNSYGVQIKGTARLMDGTEDSFFKGASLYMRTLYGPERWDAMDEETQKATIGRIATVNEWVEIVPTEYVVTNLAWSFNTENSRRPQYYDPQSPFFGKEPRQVYYVVD
ncbi:MAG: pyridoxamine 5'-phosphate oxidase family protein [Clostridia bacterium]|nr:pyridoxamine 5'-phosphate oxidase family protein [Clostridia bacterium]